MIYIDLLWDFEAFPFLSLSRPYTFDCSLYPFVSLEPLNNTTISGLLSIYSILSFIIY